MKPAKLLLLSSLLLMACGSPRSARVHGSIEALGPNPATMTYTGIAADIADISNVVLRPDAAGNVDTTFALDGPGYYKVWQNILYISPGDDIGMTISRRPTESTFTGSASAANEYLKGARWSTNENLGISFLDRPPFETIVSRFDSLMTLRRGELDALDGVDRTFREGEAARLMADRIELYLNNVYHTEFYKWDAPADEKERMKKEYYATIAPQVEPMLAQIDGNEALLDVQPVRNMLMECYRSGCFRMNATPRLKELAATADHLAAMDGGVTESTLPGLQTFASSIGDPGLRRAFSAKLDARTRLMAGQAAPDIELRDAEGNISRLSDLKGKPLYVDFWATWCMPCLAQSPHFEQLSREYPEITFVGISVDQDVEKWLTKILSEEDHGGVKEYNTEVFAASEPWDIASIPRFLLIDKDFRIVTAYAPRPSDTETVIPLLDSLAGR